MKSLIVYISIILAVCNVSFAGITGKIVGRVLDETTGQPLPGANLILKGTGMGAAADFGGNFIILNIPPGTYILTARMIGYQTVDYENVRVTIDLTTTINFDLGTQALEAGEVVTVIAKAPLVRLDLTSSSVSVTAEQIAALPVNDFSGVVDLQAGVVDGHFRGGRGGEVLYLVDGIPVNDVFSGDLAFQVENNAIQEMEIISEYGQVQSGVVNVVTKEGGQNYTGQISSYIGDYVTGNNDIFENIDDRNPTAIFDMKASLSGPIPTLGEHITFYVSGRKFHDEGHLYGKTVYNPSVTTNVTDVFPQSEWKYKSMNQIDRKSIQGKLTYVIDPQSKKDKINIDLFKQNIENRGAKFDHLFRYSPDGMATQFKDSWSAGIRWSRILSENTFFTFKLHHLQNTIRSYVFEDPLDSRYSSDDRLRQRGNFSFYSGGTDMSNDRRQTRTNLIKADFTSQVSSIHQIRGGVEGKFHRLSLHDFNVRNNASSNFESFIPVAGGTNNQAYIQKPKEFSAYLQDKIEIDYLIINGGLRIDIFDPVANVLLDFSRPQILDPNDSTLTLPRLGEKAEKKFQVSPRFGIAYPITDRGVIHISYGHFFQIPSFEFLFTNPNFSINTESGRASVFAQPFGNADLKPQKTITYEIGLQQQITEDIAIDVTGYYKDIRNLLATKIETIATGETHSGVSYGRFINRDFGNVRGLIFSFEKRASNNISGTLDYTYQIAKGNASDPKSVLIDNQSDPPVQTEKELVPLDWDRTQSMTLTVSLGPPKKYLISIIGKMGTGLPYTPSFLDQRTGLENSERRPITLNFDVNAFKVLNFNGIDATIFVRVFNLFDRLNEREVYKDTGRATYTLEANLPGIVKGLNTKEEFFNRPDWYSPPRQVNFGITIDF